MISRTEISGRDDAEAKAVGSSPKVVRISPKRVRIRAEGYQHLEQGYEDQAFGGLMAGLVAPSLAPPGAVMGVMAGMVVARGNGGSGDIFGGIGNSGEEIAPLLMFL